MLIIELTSGFLKGDIWILVLIGLWWINVSTRRLWSEMCSSFWCHHFGTCQFSISEVTTIRYILCLFVLFSSNFTSHRDMIIKDFQAYFESFCDYFPDSSWDGKKWKVLKNNKLLPSNESLSNVSIISFFMVHLSTYSETRFKCEPISGAQEEGLGWLSKDIFLRFYSWLQHGFYWIPS